MSARVAVAAWFAALLLVACGAGDDAGGERWSVEGPLLAWEGEVWIVDRVPIVVPDPDRFALDRVLGATVIAEGYVDAQGRRITDSIAFASGEWPDSTLKETSVSGIVETVAGSDWRVSGTDVVVPESASIAEGAASPDATVTVTGFELPDGRLLAESIVHASQADEDVDTSDPEEVPPGAAAGEEAEPASAEGEPAEDAKERKEDEKDRDKSDDKPDDDKEDEKDEKKKDDEKDAESDD